MGENRTDAELVEATLRGDTTAYAALFERHIGAVRTAVRGHVGRDYDAVEDGAQEAFTRALARIDTLREPSRFRPWLLQIARNTATDLRRHNTKIEREQIDDGGGEGVVLVDDDSFGPEVEAELRELAQEVHGAVAGLSQRDMTAISMVLWLGFGPREIGQALGITSGAAKVLLHRARKRMRDTLMLRALARSRSADCEEYATLAADGSQPGITRHLGECEVCLETAREHLGLQPIDVDTG